MRLQIFWVLLPWLTCFGVLSIITKNASMLGGANESVDILLKLIWSPWLYVAILLYAACAVLYLLALRLFPLSVAGPVFMTAGVFASVVLGVLYFGEALPVARTIGLLLCLSGIVLLSR